MTYQLAKLKNRHAGFAACTMRRAAPRRSVCCGVPLFYKHENKLACCYVFRQLMWLEWNAALAKNRVVYILTGRYAIQRGPLSG